jgi:DNA-binding CsgD family transcriptional regulator
MKTLPAQSVAHVQWVTSQKIRFASHGNNPLYEYLTKREIEIIRLLSEEHDSEEVAGLLCISRSTVDTHRKNIMKNSIPEV